AATRARVLAIPRASRAGGGVPVPRRLRAVLGDAAHDTASATHDRRAQPRYLRRRARTHHRCARQARAGRSHLTMAAAGPLADVKVLDFFWVMAGPAATRVLADYGAVVVRVESTERLDTARTLAPFFRAELGPENSGCFQNLNAGKRMLTLDVSHPDGRAVALDLVRWADVVCESFSPGRMAKLGLDYARLRAVRPDVIMLSSCLMGQTGPLARFAGYGHLAA